MTILLISFGHVTIDGWGWQLISIYSDLKAFVEEVLEIWRHLIPGGDLWPSGGGDQVERPQRRLVQVRRLPVHHLDGHDAQRPGGDRECHLRGLIQQSTGITLLPRFCWHENKGCISVQASYPKTIFFCFTYSREQRDVSPCIVLKTD